MVYTNMIYNKDDMMHKHPEEKEYHRKKAATKKFYAIDVRPGDIVRYDSGQGKYFGLVVETKETVDGGENEITFGKIHWSLDEPEQVVVKNGWHQFNTSMWAVMNR